MIGEKELLAMPWDTAAWKYDDNDTRIRVRAEWARENVLAVDVAVNINNHSGCVTAVRMFVCREPEGLCMQAYNEPSNRTPEKIERVKPRDFDALLGMMRWGIDITNDAEITPEDERRIADFLGDNAGKPENHNHQLIPLHMWTVDALDRIERERRDKHGLFQDDDVIDCPDEIPQYALDWIRGKVREDHVILYKSGNVSGRCCACGRKFKLTDYRRGEKFHHQTRTVCPLCGTSCYTVSERSSRPEVQYLDDMAFFQAGKNGVIWLRQFHLQRDGSIFDEVNQLELPYNKLGDWLVEFGRFAIRGERVALWLHECRSGYMGGNWVQWLDTWERKGKLYVAGNSSYQVMAESLKIAVEGMETKPRLAYCDLPGYLKSRGRGNCAPIMYTVRWAQYPVLEMLEKCGYRELVDAKVCGSVDRNVCKLVRYDAKNAKAVFTLPKQVMCLFAPKKWTIYRLRAAGIMQAVGVRTERMPDWMDGNYLDERLLRTVAPHMTKSQLKDYIERQNVPELSTGRPKVTEHEIIDYINECVFLGRDLKNKTVLFPRDLRTAHEDTSREKKFRQKEISKKQMRARVEKLEKYAWEKDSLLIRPAESSVELSQEGEALRHCVGTYSEDYAKGETEIWFVRRADKPDEPYFTCEYKAGRIVQCRTFQNRGYETEPEVHVFVGEWAKKRSSKWFEKQNVRIKVAAAS